VSAVALAAAGLAMIGLYGVMRTPVTARAGEIAIRKALGAGAATLSRSSAGRVALLVLAGLALGRPPRSRCPRLIAPQLWGITPRDPASSPPPRSRWRPRPCWRARLPVGGRSRGPGPAIALRVAASLNPFRRRRAF
jgi:hypothetical protein